MIFELLLTFAASANPKFVKSCDECGEFLKKKGWVELARCDGHSWKYIIEKNGDRRLCTGIAARGGLTEFPCTKFDGELKSFKRCKEQ